MHVDVSPRTLDLVPGIATTVTVTISNTGLVIGGYQVRILGADPRWVELDEPAVGGLVSLFPEETVTVRARITVPHGLPAGERTISVQVSEQTAPFSSVVEQVLLRVPAARQLGATADPATQHAGRTGRFTLVLDNQGNTEVAGHLHGQDAEGKVRFRFDPPAVSLAPGEHAVVDVRARAKQQFLGSMKVRTVDLHVLDELPVPIPLTPPENPSWRTRLQRRPRPRARVAETVRPLAQVTLVQRPVVARSLMALTGLLAAVTVFGLVITLALSKIVGQSAADRNLALEIAAARDAAAQGGTSSMSGTVRLLTSGTPVPGVAVTVYAADDTEKALSTTATAADGTWRVNNLAAGSYKATFRGAGFVQLWYPRTAEEPDGLVIEVEKGVARNGLDVDLGGVPATISGTVVGEDVSAATLSLRTPAGSATAPAGTTSTSPATSASSATGGSGAVVQTVPIGADGSFQLTSVPSPSVYDLVVEKKGFATSTQRVDVSAGEERAGVEITLRRGDGLIQGHVSDGTGPLGGVQVQVSAGSVSSSAMTLTEGDVGAFTVRSLPTPGTFTVVASKAGYASVTQTLTLAAGQRLAGLQLTLNKSSGSLRGIVRELPFETPAGGVVVSVTDGQRTLQTATQSQGSPGTWRVDGLAVPGTYTLTFSRSNLASQTVSVVLDGRGNTSSQSQTAAVADGRLEVTMQPSSATVEGTVRQRAGTARNPMGEVTVQLTSTQSTYTVITASVPAGNLGEYRIEGVAPGTYTVSVSREGVTPTSTLLELKAGDIRTYSPVLAPAAKLQGRVLAADTSAPLGAGWVVELYRSSAYPAVVYRTTTTNARGAWSFADVDAPEAYVVQVRRSQGSSPAGSSTVQVDRSKSVTVDVKAETDG